MPRSRDWERRKDYGDKEKGVEETEDEKHIPPEAQETLEKRPGESRMRLMVVSLPRGAVAAVWIDPVTGVIASNHQGLQTLFRSGVRDFSGHVLFPSDGQQFLSALYDHLFLSGYAVRWFDRWSTAT